MTDLSSVDAKIQWAEKHIEDLQARLTGFWKSKPYTLVVQQHPEFPERRQMIVRIHRGVPACIALTVGDIVHNLHCALDHLACTAVTAEGNSATSTTKFPIPQKRTPAPQDYRSLVQGNVKGAGQDFIDALLCLQPYPGGHHELLWALHYLDIRDKHHLLLALFAAYPHIALDYSMFLGKPPSLDTVALREEGKCPLKDGDVLFDAVAEQMEKMNPEPSIEVALGEPPILRCKPLLPTLTNLSQFTTDIIDQLRRVL